LASICGHVDFSGADWVWQDEPDTDPAHAEWINQVDFFKRYNVTTGLFGSMSFACVRRSAMNRLGPEPFQFIGAEDSYMFYQMSLFGGVVLFKSPLVAYNVHVGSLSSNRLRMLPLWVNVFGKLEPVFEKCEIQELRKAFSRAYAVKRRHYAKVLLGAGRPVEARDQLLRSIGNCQQPASVARSIAIWSASWLPTVLQPKWPSAARAAENDGLAPRSAERKGDAR
jgi:hypothetical protein